MNATLQFDMTEYERREHERARRRIRRERAALRDHRRPGRRDSGRISREVSYR